MGSMSWFGRQGGEAERKPGGGLQACFLTLSLVQPDSPVLSEPAPHLELSPAEDATVIRETRPDNDTKVVPVCPRCHILRLALFRLGHIA